MSRNSLLKAGAKSDIVFYLKNHIFSFNYMILCIKYLVMFIDFMCYVSITVLYSFSYFQAMLVAIDTTKFCYSLFPRRLFHLSCNTYWWLMKRLICFYLCMPILKQCKNRTPEHILKDNLSKYIFCYIYVCFVKPSCVVWIICLHITWASQRYSSTEKVKFLIMSKIMAVLECWNIKKFLDRHGFKMNEVA